MNSRAGGRKGRGMSKTPRTDVFLTSDEMDAGLAAFMGTSRIKAFASFARKLETDLADKEKQLAEAQAEIENLKWHINSEKAKAEAALALNDRALELVNEARADAEHWKSECNALQRMAHEARAEIKLKNEELDMFLAEQRAMGEIIESKDKQFAERTRQRDAYKKALEIAEDELMAARAEIESLKLSAGELNGAFNARPKCEKCKDKDKLIEQMREIINDYRIEHKAWCNHDPDNAKECTCGLSEKVKAALAAERGE